MIETRFTQPEVPYETLAKFGLTQEMLENLLGEVYQEILNGRRTDEISIRNKDIKIQPEDYVKLLTLFLYDKNMNFNKLRHAAPEVYERILREVDDLERDNDTNCYHCEDPYCVTFPEVKEDVKNIISKHPEIEQSTGCGYRFSY